MRNKEGLLLAATFSYGCNMANELGLTPKLKEYAQSKGKSHSGKEIREALSQLIPYFFYRIIALANNIEDPFEIRVVKAHWIGSELLERVKPAHIKKMFEEFQKEGWDSVLLALSLKSILEKDRYLHHNKVFTAGSPECKVVLREGYFWHLGEKRIRASKEDIENFKKYGGS